MSDHSESHISVVQVAILRAMGFLPFAPGKHKRHLSKIHCDPSKSQLRSVLQSVITVTILAGTSLFAGMKIVHVAFKIYDAGSKDAIFKFLTQLPGVSVYMRLAIVLLLFYWKRQSFSPLFEGLTILLDSDMTLKSRVLRKVPKLSVALLVATFFMYMGYSVTNWTNDILGDSSRQNVTMWSPASRTPFYLGMSNWQYLFGSVVFRDLAFILSQQVYITAIILCVSLADVVKSIFRDVATEIGALESSLPIDLRDLEQKLSNWRGMYVKVTRLVSQINRFFGPIFLVTYSLDLTVVLGSAARFLTIASSDSEIALTVLFTVTCIVTFGIYATVLPIPFVTLSEKVGECSLIVIVQ